MMNSQRHWNTVYGTKGEQDVSWFEALPTVSLELIEASGLTPETCILDVGGGESRLVDALLAKGVRCVAVLDISGEPLRHAQVRLGTQADIVTWIEADVTGAWSLKPMDIWHDRAVFHFLVAPEQRAAYVARLRKTLKPEGHAILATFALDGPERCSGLPVMRYSPEMLAAELGKSFELVEARSYQHLTPWGTSQSFAYSRLRRVH
jgi:ubiquinone/menaquinone biosynthesis C-methylase UbiE